MKQLQNLLDLLQELKIVDSDNQSTSPRSDQAASITEKQPAAINQNQQKPQKKPESALENLVQPKSEKSNTREDISPQVDFLENLSSSQKRSKVTSDTHNPDMIESDLSDLHQQIAALKTKLASSEDQMYELTELVNSLIPFIVELLKLKLNDSREGIAEAIIPVIDEIIVQRSAQDQQKMAAAIADILPIAIAEEIKASPQSIAKAIAPEIALSIQEQIILDQDAISHALGSEMGKAIKTQIDLEKDAMVDALYPVIGNTISKYMVEVVRSINEKIENVLSPEGVKRKIRAKIQGVSEAELILQEAVGYKVQAIFLIHKASGLLIREVQLNEEYKLESDLIAGMLTAIRSFANDCIAKPSELNMIDYGDSQIILEVAGYCYLALVIEGEPSKKFIKRIRITLGRIVLKYGRAIAAYNGDPATVPESIQTLLDKLAEPELPESKPSSKPAALLLLLGIILGLIFVPWGIVRYRHIVTNRIERDVAVALNAAPELSIYRIIPQVYGNKLILTGKVPSEYLRRQAAKVVNQIATEKELELDNQIIAVVLPPDPTLAAQEVERVTSLFNQLEGIAINSNYQDQKVTISGYFSPKQNIQTIITAFEQIPGVKTVIFIAEKQLPQISTRIYFKSNSAELNSADMSSKIKQVTEFLNQNTQLHLRLIGHSDILGSRRENQELGLKRARNVQAALIAQGIDPDRLQIRASTQRPPDVTLEQPLWLSRCVRFEPFIAAIQPN